MRKNNSNFALKFEFMMKRPLVAILLTTVVLLPMIGKEKSSASPGKEVRAVWLTTIGGIDWPHTYAHDEYTINKQKLEFVNILDKLKKININTVLLQTRIRGTVIYPSAFEPWDGCVSGNPGKSPGYDPLQFAIEECHRRGMELHAWVVSLPVGKWNALGCRQLRQRFPSIIRKIGEDGFLNPEMPKTAEVLADVCGEITKNYDIDGIHLDYIRYPETWKIKVPRQQGRENITYIVRKVHDRVKSIKPHVKMSCSPLGKYDDLARYSSKGWNARNTVCQDAQMWLKSGLMDQLYPMIYFKENHFYPFAIDWAESSDKGQVAVGLGIYFLDSKEGNWKIEEVKRQLNVSRAYGLGQCFFRTKFLLDNVQGIYDYLRIFNFADGWQTYKSLFSIPVASNPLSESSKQPSDSISAHLGKWIRNDGFRMSLPEKGKVLDADFILIESIFGNGICTKPYRGKYADISNLANGIYIVKSLGKKGTVHRLGWMKVKRGNNIPE